MKSERHNPSAPGFAGGSVPAGGPTPAGWQRVLATFVTTTSYGTWLPGDLRGYIQDGMILPPNPRLLDHARSLLAKAPVIFSPAQIVVLDQAIRAAAEEFGYRLTDLSIESWHLHWIVEHGFDPVPDMVGRLKTRMRQRMNRGRIWTDGYCHRCLYSAIEIERGRRYVGRHAGCRMIGGRSRSPTG